MVQQIKLILEEVRGVPGLASRLTDTASIIDDAGLDSLQVMEFMLALEDRLNVRIDFEKMQFAHLSSIAALSEFLSATSPSVS